MNKYLFQFILIPLGIFILICFTAEALVINASIRDYIQEAEYILEGHIADKLDDNKRDIQTYVGEQAESIRVGIGSHKTFLVKVDKVHRGLLAQDNMIKVYAPDNPSNPAHKLRTDKKYLLFLKPLDEKRAVYAIINQGRGYWRIFDYHGQTKLKAWYQEEALRESEEYTDYRAFLRLLKGFE